MDYSKVSVLVTDAAGKQSIVMVRGLKEIGCRVTVVCSSRSTTGYASNRPDEKIINKEIADHTEQGAKELLELLKSGKYDVVMPVGEMGTDFITSHEDMLRPYAALACAPRDIYINAFDKQRTFEYAFRTGVPMPKTRMSDQPVDEFISETDFPLIIKPRNGLGSIGFHKFEKREDFEPYIAEHGIDIDDYVLQECVDYDKRLGTILFVDRDGTVCMGYADEVLRWYPLDAGSACMIRSIDDPKVLGWSADLLKAMKWQGIAALSFMVDKHTGVPKLLEINGRIPASIRLSRQCGYNVAKMLIDLALGEPVDRYPFNKTEGLCTRHFDTDLAWFVKSPTRFKTKPSWFSWKNTKDALYFRDDKKPFIVNFFSKLLNYKAIMKRKRH